MPGINPLQPSAGEARFTVSTTVLPLPTYFPSGQANTRLRANCVEIQVQANSVRYTTNGTTPAGSGNGILKAAGDTILLESWEEVRKFRVVRDSADATLQCEYFNGYIP